MLSALKSLCLSMWKTPQSSYLFAVIPHFADYAPSQWSRNPASVFRSLALCVQSLLCGINKKGEVWQKDCCLISLPQSTRTEQKGFRVKMKHQGIFCFTVVYFSTKLISQWVTLKKLGFIRNWNFCLFRSNIYKKNWQHRGRDSSQSIFTDYIF